MDSYNTDWKKRSDMNNIKISYKFIKCAKLYWMDTTCSKPLNDHGGNHGGGYLCEARGRGMGSEK